MASSLWSGHRRQPDGRGWGGAALLVMRTRLIVPGCSDRADTLILQLRIQPVAPGGVDEDEEEDGESLPGDAWEPMGGLARPCTYPTGTCGRALLW